MSLRTFHLFFIFTAIALSMVFGAWTIWHYPEMQDNLVLALGVVTLAGGVALGRLSCIELPLGQALVASKRRSALHVERGYLELGLRAFEIGFGLLDRKSVGPWIDDEQEIALLDHLAVTEMDLIEVARHASANLDRVYRNEATDILILIRDAALDRFRHRDSRRRRRSSRLLTLTATGQHRRKQNDGGGEPRMEGVSH